MQVSPVFISNFINGELVGQAERKELPSTHEPDLDNANVGSAFMRCGKFQIGVSRFLFCRKGCERADPVCSGRMEGERLLSCMKRWEPVFRGERGKLIPDRAKQY